MQKINVTITLPALDGQGPLRLIDAYCPECNRAREDHPATLRECLVIALSSDFPGERVGGKEKFRRFNLALRITDRDEVDLKPKDLVLLQDLAAKRFSPLFVGRIWQALGVEPETADEDESETAPAYTPGDFDGCRGLMKADITAVFTTLAAFETLLAAGHGTNLEAVR